MNNTLTDRIARAFARPALLFAACALAMTIAFVPGTALAGADDEGDLDAPNAAAADGGAGAATAQEDTAADDAVHVAADGKAASMDGSPFALEDFSRSQVGSNGDIDGTYAGYRYFVSDKPGSLAVIATDACIVVYVPNDVAEQGGFDKSAAESRS